MSSPKMNSPKLQKVDSPKLNSARSDSLKQADILNEPIYEASGILQVHDFYVRLLTMVNHSTSELYYQIFHDANDCGYPTEPTELYSQLKKMEKKFIEMKKSNHITEDELNILLPISKETYSQDFSISLFHKLCQTCLLTWNENHNMDNRHRTEWANVLDALDKVKDLYHSDHIKNLDEEDFFAIWEEICDTLKSLKYDVTKLQELQNGSLELKKFRFAVIKSQHCVLNNVLLSLIKTTKINLFTIEKLILNLREATSEYKELFHQNECAISEKDLLQLKENIGLTANMLQTLKEDISALYPDMKFWREKNIEGDIIVIDERLCRLKNQINEQSFNVKSLFGTISLDIVKMKEKVNDQGENQQYVISTLERSKSNTSLLGKSRDNILKNRSSTLINGYK